MASRAGGIQRWHCRGCLSARFYGYAWLRWLECPIFYKNRCGVAIFKMQFHAHPMTGFLAAIFAKLGRHTQSPVATTARLPPGIQPKSAELARQGLIPMPNAADGSEDHVHEMRDELRQLFREGRFDEATDLAQSLSDDVLMGTPAEAIADAIRARSPRDAKRLYQVAILYYRWEGTQATGSGEGLMAMDHIKTLESKIARLES